MAQLWDTTDDGNPERPGLVPLEEETRLSRATNGSRPSTRSHRWNEHPLSFPRSETIAYPAVPQGNPVAVGYDGALHDGIAAGPSYAVGAAAPSYAVGGPAESNIEAKQQDSSLRIGRLESVWDRGNQLPDVKTLIVDDCKLHRENLAAMFAVNIRNGNALPAVAWDLPSLTASLEECAPDIVLLSMATRDNGTLLQVIREKCPQAKVVAVGLSGDDESKIVACAEAGVVGYHLRTESLDDLIGLISKVADGELTCSPHVSAILLKRLSVLASQRQPTVRGLVLTARELQILRMLELGLSNRDIADRLCIAVHTVKNHVHSVLGKLGVSTRLQAAAFSRSLRYDEACIEDLGTTSL